MAGIKGTPTIADLDLYSSSTVSPGPLGIGQYILGGKGRGYRYGLVGASALVMGNLLQAPAQDTTYENMAVTASAAGQNILNVTNGTATITNAQFEGGTISTYTAGTVAVGDQYDILSVTGTLTTGGALTVAVDRPLRAAFSTSAKVNMKRSPWSGIIQAPATTQTDIAVGVAIWANTAATYGWVQTHGIAAVLSDGSTFAVGSDVGTPSGTAGCATVFAAGTTHMRIGTARQAAAAAKCIEVFLQID